MGMSFYQTIMMLLGILTLVIFSKFIRKGIKAHWKKLLGIVLGAITGVLVYVYGNLFRMENGDLYSIGVGIVASYVWFHIIKRLKK